MARVWHYFGACLKTPRLLGTFRGYDLSCMTDTKRYVLLPKFPLSTVQSILPSLFVYRLRHDSSTQPSQQLQNIGPVSITVFQERLS